MEFTDKNFVNLHGTILYYYKVIAIRKKGIFLRKPY